MYLVVPYFITEMMREAIPAGEQLSDYWGGATIVYSYTMPQMVSTVSEIDSAELLAEYCTLTSYEAVKPKPVIKNVPRYLFKGSCTFT